MRRRDFLAFTGAAALISPRLAWAQDNPLPVIGYLGAASFDTAPEERAAFRDGLAQTGFIDGTNVKIVYRWAEGRYSLLTSLARDLVVDRVALIVALGSPNAPMAAKSATSTIPILFAVGNDPIELGLVTSLDRPAGNLTGLTFRFVEAIGKRIEFLHELLPEAKDVALLINSSAASGEGETKVAEAVTHRLGQNLVVLRAGNEGELATAFATAADRKVAAVALGADPALNSTLAPTVAALALRHGLPTVANARGVPVSGGLASYGPSLVAGYRRAGVLAGRILRGSRPSDLSVEVSDVYQLVVNLVTAKSLGIVVPRSLLARADIVIE